jgi:hypothetical protein
LAFFFFLDSGGVGWIVIPFAGNHTVPSAAGAISVLAL